MTSGSATPGFDVGVTYWPEDVGPYFWHEFRVEQVRADLALIRDQGFGSVRVLLGWDAFMPSDREPHPARVGELGMLLDAAGALSLSVVPVLFAQSLGDCLTLPDYAILPRGRRPGVRVVTGGRVRPGGPRDMYADPLMLEMESRWLEGLLASCAGHPAIAAWDLGHDPATTLRPRLFTEFRSWISLMAAQVRASGDRCRLTLGSGDLLSARGVRFSLVGDLVDSVGLAILPQMLTLGDDPLSADPSTFLTQLGRRLLGEAAPPLVVSTGVATGTAGGETGDEAPEPAPRGAGDGRRRTRRSPRDPEPVPPPVAAEHAAGLLPRLRRSGAGGALAWTWTGVGPRAMIAPPFDRFPSLGRCGLVDGAGSPAAAGEIWSDFAREGLDTVRAAPWPARLDEADYYQNLPESALDLLASWRGAHEHEPGILA